MANLVREKALPLLKQVKTYWKIPPQGRYMSFKEIFSLAFGGIGIKFIVYCINNMLLSTTNALIGNTIGIKPGPLYVIYIIGVLSNFPFTAIRANLIDNTRSMKGKYRPYILSMAIPTVLLGIGFVWMPYENMSMLMKCIVVLAFNIGFQFFYNFMNESYESLLNVLSPNTYERSDVSAVKAVVENLSPSIVGIFLPIFANMITGKNDLYNLSVYRVLYPVLLILGFIISLPVYMNTREKIIQAKTHVIQIKFVDALRSVIRNKYFWIISLAGWLGFLESAFSRMLEWMYHYQKACSPGQYALIVAISSNASFWPNLFTPLLVRKYGKRNILVFTNMLSIVFIGIMLPVVKINNPTMMIWTMMLCFFINSFVTAMGGFLNPSIQADIRDYQQYITGERIDGMFSTVGLVGSVITLATSSVLPMIYTKAGLNEETALRLGYDGSNVYDVLYDPEYFVKVCSVLLIASAVGAALNVLPYFFYDLTETKQRSMVSVLKIRAMFEDYGNGQITDDALIEAVEIIEEAKTLSEQNEIKIDRNAVKKVKGKENKKKANSQLKKDMEFNTQVQISKFVMAELNKFKTDEGRAQLDNAKAIVNAGMRNSINNSEISMRAAKAMPKTTALEKERRSDAINEVRKLKTAQKTVKKYYPDGIEEFDTAVFDKLFSLEDEVNIQIFELTKKIREAKEEKNHSLIKELNAEFSALKVKRTQIGNEIKKAGNQNAIYHRAAKPYLDAVKLLKYEENLEHYDELLLKYNGLKVN